MLAREKHARCLAILTYNAGLLAGDVSKRGRDGVLFRDADVVLAVAGEEAVVIVTSFLCM